MKRTHSCGSLTSQMLGQQVVLTGWVAAVRDHGGLLFIDLRDEQVMAQLVFNPEGDAALHARAREVRPEYVVGVEGQVKRRPAGTENPRLTTGGIEIGVARLEIINISSPLPFELDAAASVSEEVRLAYRFVDLKRAPMQRTLRFRHRLTLEARNWLASQGFVEIETPVLTRSTPEGARDFLVPSRLVPGTFYALPQSPQQFKQVLMVSGFEKYFQIARCFRDEDLRSDRQPEHTQIDLEMSFVDEDEVIRVVEGLVSRLYQSLLGIKLEIPFPRLKHAESLARFGTDKPDMRFGMELADVSVLVRETELKIFRAVMDQGGVVLALATEGKPRLSREDLNRLTEWVKEQGGQGLAWLKAGAGDEGSPISKFFPEGLVKRLAGRLKAAPGETLFFIADKPHKARMLADMLRRHLASRLDLIPSKNSFVWITEFPLFEWSEDEGRWVSMHHPFTAPLEADAARVENDAGSVYARAYDLVLNGTEVAGGSIRIHRRDLQEKVFKVLGIGEVQARAQFSFLLNALEYGAPPHGGIAVGLDRLIMLMLNLTTIRDTIAFPKTQKGTCLVSGAPATVSDRQLKELNIKILQRDDGRRTTDEERDE
ncbi:MAG: aspartate--tRNA ligase [Candidatus Omnitrophica bacterium]|nr:aspartate--tRNA ligase [Candidatus Omnitrophota bacterium]